MVASTRTGQRTQKPTAIASPVVKFIDVYGASWAPAITRVDAEIGPMIVAGWNRVAA